MTAEQQLRDRTDRPPTVSVIIPAYGVNAYIAEAVDSVLAQTYEDCDVYVVNDGAPAAETAELKEILARYGARVNYIERENGGQGAARNTALRATRAPYVAFLDGDDYWHPELLAREMAVFEQDPRLALVYADARIFGDGPVVGLTYMETEPSEGEVTLESLLAVRCNVTMSTIVARRDAIIEAGLFDESLRYIEDYDLWLRMAHRRMRMTYLRDVLAYRRVRLTALSANGLNMLRVLLSVLDRFAKTHELTRAEREACEATVARFRSDVAIIEGKDSLSTGRYDVAADAFRAVDPQHLNWKVRIARVGLVTVPTAISLVYRGWGRLQEERLRRRSAAAARRAAAPTDPAAPVGEPPHEG
jgi:cellulose synthase/poly-beta-1,6-N-acetylglucosamine synthase-like glycosyltransferase